MNKNDVRNDNIQICKNCGVPLEPGLRFCENCGAQVTEPEPEQSMEIAPEQPFVPETEQVYQGEAYAPTSDIPFPDASVQEQPSSQGQRVPAKKTGVFVSGILGFMVLAALITAAIVAGVFSQNFLRPINLIYIFIQVMTFGALAIAIVLTTRAKGPDLSMGAVMALAAVIAASFGSSYVIGIVVALSVCATIGMLNGVFIVIFKVPSLIMTIIVSVIVRGVVYVLTNGREIILRNDFIELARFEVAGIPIAPLAIFGAAFIVVFLLVLLSKLGKPLSKREEKDGKSISYFAAYIVSSLITCLVGLYTLSRLAAASPIIGFRYEIFIILVFAAVTSSRFLDNRWAPVFYAVVIALFYAVLINVSNLYGISPYITQIISGVIALGLVLISYIARKDTFKEIAYRL